MEARLRKNLLPSIIFAILAVATAAFGAYYYRVADAKLTDEVFVRRSTVASLAASAIKIKVEQLAELGMLYTSNPVIKSSFANKDWNGAIAEVKSLLDDPRYYDFYIDRIILLDTTGKIRAAFPGIDKSAVGVEDDAIGEWRKPLIDEHRAYYATDVYKRKVFPKVSLVELVLPVKNSGAISGFLEFPIPINEFSDFGTDVELGRGGFAYIVDKKGQLIFHPSFSTDGPIVDYSSARSVQKLIQGETGVWITYNPIEQVERVAAYEKVPGIGWGVVAQEPTKDAFENRDYILSRILWLTILSCLFEFCVLFLILKKKNGTPDI